MLAGESKSQSCCCKDISCSAWNPDQTAPSVHPRRNTIGSWLEPPRKEESHPHGECPQPTRAKPASSSTVPCALHSH